MVFHRVTTMVVQPSPRLILEFTLGLDFRIDLSAPLKEAHMLYSSHSPFSFKPQMWQCLSASVYFGHFIQMES